MRRAVLFDLDGTILDTAPDLAAALNRLRMQCNSAPLAFKDIRPVCSAGVKGLLNLGFNITEDAPQYANLRQQFLTDYELHIADKTRLFTGIAELLQTLDKQRIPWGIVTNKAAKLTLPLLTKLNLAERAYCIVSGDTLPQCKPHPAPLLYAAQQLNILPQYCWYVGDAERDIIAAKRAGMTSVAVAYGYEQDFNDWGADWVIETPEKLLKLFDR